MGRIAEALRRAQQERSRRLSEEATPDPCESSSREPSPGGARTAADDILPEPPEVVQPFVTHSPPLTPEMIGAQVEALHHPSSAIAERYRAVRTRLISANPTGNPRVLAVASSIAGEGKTVTAANLGFSLAELRQLRVLLIDLDFRTRGLSRLFGAADSPGVAELLRGEAKLVEVSRPLVRSNCLFVPAGDPKESSATDLLGSSAATAMFRQVQERFDYTLLDTPPVETSADIGLIGPLCHAVLMVIRMNHTPESLLCRSVRQLQASQIPVAGCILTGYSESALNFNETHEYFEPVG